MADYPTETMPEKKIPKTQGHKGKVIESNIEGKALDEAKSTVRTEKA